MITSAVEVNEIGLHMFETKSARSLDRNPKLFRKVFKNMRFTTTKQGEPTVVLKVDLVPFKRIMRGIANAVFFKDFDRKYLHPQKWWIYGATLNTEYEYWGIPDLAHPRMRDAISRLTITERNTGMPEVFQYAIYQESEEKTIYKLVFYEGVVVCAISYA